MSAAPDHDADADSPVSPALQGHIDTAISTKISGWAWDPGQPGNRVEIELAEGTVRLATVVADAERVDLVGAGIGDGRYGFQFDLDALKLPAGDHVLAVRDTATGAAVPGSPIALSIAPPPAEPPFRWYVDAVSAGGVGGWIAPRHGPAHRCVVVLMDRGAVIARTVAAEFRGDLLSAGIGDGCHSFRIPLPQVLLDGEVHSLEIVEEETGFPLTREPILWRFAPGATTDKAASPGEDPGSVAPAYTGPRILFDISDLVYYLGRHNNLTGIQRVQSSVILAMVDAELVPHASTVFISFNQRTGNWVATPRGYLISLLHDLFLPEGQRVHTLAQDDAKDGILPGAQPFTGAGVLDDGRPSVLCLMGAAWVQRDYTRRMLLWKRQFGTRFVMTIHDLIPIYARETCDQDTVRVFEEFMLRALPHVDHILAVSEYTASDVRRYMATLGIPVPSISVTRNGSSFAEFLPGGGRAPVATQLALPDRFVLFVATIEGRKNHRLIYDIWQRLLNDGIDPPHLICVGRLGWKATPFVNALVESNYLNGKVHLLREVSDTELRVLYERCLFTVCPTFYEGWGLPVGESLSMGKICVCSTRSSIPEVAGDCGVYMDIDKPAKAYEVVRDLIVNAAARAELEARIASSYQRITWRSVAERVIAACNSATQVEWPSPYPHAGLPYATEVSFASLNKELDGSGELLLRQILTARQARLQITPLNDRNFLLGEAIRGSGNWAYPEPWGIWLCDSRCEMTFKLPAESARVDIVLRVRACEALFTRPVRMLVNGEELWNGEIGPSTRTIVMRVRRTADSGNWWMVRLAAEIELTAELRSQIAALDRRIPTIGFERLIAIPDNDYGARLDLLTRLATTR